jgi:ribose 5-phosphate isomerase B
MIIHLATDHAGFEHKEAVLVWLRQEGFEVVDHGATIKNEQDDFPDYISKAVAEYPASTKGIIFGGSGQGEAMLANRYPRVRCAVFYGGEETIPALSRQHNDSNILSIGARFVDINTTKKVIWTWLHTETLPDEKYSRRNKKIEKITNSLPT